MFSERTVIYQTKRRPIQEECGIYSNGGDYVKLRFNGAYVGLC
jgi:hypothetical protein